MDYRKQYCYVFGNYKFTGEDGKQNFTKWRRYHVSELVEQIIKKSKDGNAFATIQQYASREEKEGELHYCDLYFDLDGSFEQTKADAIKIVRYFTADRFNLPAELVRVWYSGGKGFHILVNVEAMGCLPHKELTYIHKKAALFIESYLGLKTLDTASIYSIRRMWRIPDSRHHSGKYKVELYHGELFDKTEEEIKEIASQVRGALWEEEDVTGVTVDEDLQAWYQDFIEAYNEDIKFRSEQPANAVNKVEKTPVCVQDLLDNHIRQEGSRNKATMTLASYYKVQGLSATETEAILLPWALRTPKELTSKHNEREIEAGTKSVIKSVYDPSGKYNFGCAFIRSLGSGTDKPITCNNDTCPINTVTLEYQITSLPENLNFQEHAVALQKIYREIAMKGPTAREHYINLLKERFKLSKQTIKEEVKAAEMNLKIEPAIPKPLDKPRDKALSLVQDVKEGIFHYLIYVPTNKGNFIPRLITSERQMEIIEDEEADLPEDMARWSVDSQTPFNVFEWLNGGKKVDLKDVYREIEGFIKTYMWYPDERFHQLVSAWIMTTYVFNVFDTVGYLALIGTKRTGKSRTLEILEQLCFNSTKADSMSDAYIYRIIERNRATLLFDEADSLRKTPDKSVNERLEIIRSGYKRAGKVGRCEGESNSTVTFSTYSPKAIANVSGLEDALEDRVIYINVERKPKEVEIKKLIFRDLERTIQVIRNKLYFFGLQYSKWIAEVYREYRNDELEDREAEIWAGVLVVAQLIGQELHDSLLSLAVENRDRKELREGLESTEAQVIMTIWNMVQENNFAHITMEGKYWATETLRTAVTEQLGWKDPMTNRYLTNVMQRLRIIEDNSDYKKRFTFKTEKGNNVKKMCYLLKPEKIKLSALKYSVKLEGEDEDLAAVIDGTNKNEIENNGEKWE